MGGDERRTEDAYSDDVELVERFRAGERAAFDVLVLRHREPIERLVRRYVHDADDGQDVVQRTFIRAFEKVAQFRGEASFRTWLHRIAVNMALNHVRGVRTDAVPIEEVADFTSALGTEKLVAAEVWRKVAVYLDELPPKQRLVVELRVFHDLPFDEIAVLADCSEDSAKANYHHGVRRLRESFPTPHDP